MHKHPIYLDYNATTPIDPRVKDAMLPYLDEYFGNPSTTYVYGQQAKKGIQQARAQVAALIGATPDEIVFTSGGSESNNQAIIGTALAHAGKGRHIVTSCIEHPAVIKTCRYLEDRLGFSVTYVPVDGNGLVNPRDVLESVTEETTLITVMHANNEVGTVEPIDEIGEFARKYQIIFHTDAAQSGGKIEVNVQKLKVDLLTLAGHKLYAPKGIGALFIRNGTVLDSYIHGAGQESGRRAGTENVPYVVGLGKACEIAHNELLEYERKTKVLRDRLYSRINAGLGERVCLNGHRKKRLPNTLNISITGIVGEALLGDLPEIAASTGAACHAGTTEPSVVLLQMGLSRELALGALRLTLGRWSTAEEVDEAAKLIVAKAN